MKKRICLVVRGLLIKNTPQDISILPRAEEFARQIKSLAGREISFCFLGGTGFRRLAKKWLAECQPKIFAQGKVYFCSNPNELARFCLRDGIGLVITANPKVKRALKAQGAPNKQAQCLLAKGKLNQPQHEAIIQAAKKIIKNKK